MIKSPNEIIFDKYGRMGNLINRNEYYLFQPLEITDEKASLHDLSVPVDYKRKSLDLELPKEIAITGKQTRGIVADAKKRGRPVKATMEKEDFFVDDIAAVGATEYMQIVETLDKQLHIATTVDEYTIPQKQWTWYMNASQIIDTLETHYKPMSVPDFQAYIINHFMNSLLLPEKLLLIGEIYSGEWEPTHEVEQNMKEYFDERLLLSEKPVKKRGILLTKDNQRQIYVQSKEDPRIWGENESEDYMLFAPSIAKKIVAPKRLQRIVGFFSLFNKKEMTFKIKDTSIKNSKGEKMDRAGKIKPIDILNILIGTQENPKPLNQDNMRDISQLGLCVLLEIIVQDKSKLDPNKIWYLTPEQSVLIKFPELNLA